MKVIIPFSLVLVNVFAAVAQDIPRLVQRAAAAEGAEYIRLRNQIVDRGGMETGLEAILKKRDANWQERVTAGICLERIRRGDEIRAFIETKWRDEPELHGSNGWMSRKGYPDELLPLLGGRMEEANLEYYYLELIWRYTGEVSRDFNLSPGTWRLLVARVLAKRKNPFLAEIILPPVQNDPEGTGWEAGHYGDILIEMGYSPIFRKMFERWQIRQKIRLEYMGYFDDRLLGKFLSIAPAEDADWVTEKLQGLPLTRGKWAYENYLRACREGNAPLVKYNPAPVPIPMRKATAPTPEGATKTSSDKK